MQKYTRCRLCLFSYNDNQDKDTYFDKDGLIWKCAENCQKALNNSSYFNNMTIAFVPYDIVNHQYLTIVGYKHHIFYGLFNGNDNHIYFEDNNSKIINLDDDYIALLEERFTNELNNPSSIPNKPLITAWEDTIPLLDKVIELENNLEKAPENVRKRMLQHYDEQLDILVKTFENNNLENSQITIENYTP